MFLAMATILIIDDEEIIRVRLRSALEAAGYEVTEAANGRQGLELYRYRPTDLVIQTLGHGRPSRSPLASRICWALCDTNWNISRMLKKSAIGRMSCASRTTVCGAGGLSQDPANTA